MGVGEGAMLELHAVAGTRTQNRVSRGISLPRTSKRRISNLRSSALPGTPLDETLTERGEWIGDGVLLRQRS